MKLATSLRQAHISVLSIIRLSLGQGAIWKTAKTMEGMLRWLCEPDSLLSLLTKNKASSLSCTMQTPIRAE